MSRPVRLPLVVGDSDKVQREVVIPQDICIMGCDGDSAVVITTTTSSKSPCGVGVGTAVAISGGVEAMGMDAGDAVEVTLSFTPGCGS